MCRCFMMDFVWWAAVATGLQGISGERGRDPAFDNQLRVQGNSSARLPGDDKQMVSKSFQATEKKQAVIHERPNKYNKVPDIISVRLKISKVRSICLRCKEAILEIWESLEWYDSGAVRKVDFAKGADTVILNLKDAKRLIWIPGLVVKEFQGEAKIAASNTYVHKNGTVRKDAVLILNTHQPFHGELYPFDNQTLYLTVIAGDGPPTEVTLRPAKHSAYSLDEDAFANVGFTPREGGSSTEFGIAYGRSYVSFVLAVDRRNAFELAYKIITPNLIILVIAHLTLFFPIEGALVARAGTVVTCAMSLIMLGMQQSGDVQVGTDTIWLSCLKIWMLALVLMVFAFNVLFDNVVNKNKELARCLRVEMRVCHLLWILLSLVQLLYLKRTWKRIVQFGVIGVGSLHLSSIFLRTFRYFL